MLFNCCLSEYQRLSFMGRYVLIVFSSTLLQQWHLPGFSDVFIEILLFQNKHFSHLRKNLMKELNFVLENDLFRSKGRSNSVQGKDSCFYEKHTCFSVTVQAHPFFLTTACERFIFVTFNTILNCSPGPYSLWSKFTDNWLTWVRKKSECFWAVQTNSALQLHPNEVRGSATGTDIYISSSPH